MICIIKKKHAVCPRYICFLGVRFNSDLFRVARYRRMSKGFFAVHWSVGAGVGVQFSRKWLVVGYRENILNILNQMFLNRLNILSSIKLVLEINQGSYIGNEPLSLPTFNT